MPTGGGAGGDGDGAWHNIDMAILGTVVDSSDLG